MKKKKVDAAEDRMSVEAYIANCPKEIQSKLKGIRAAIREVAPGATETTSYFDIPGYSYPGYDYNGMFVWFSFKEPNIRLHLRPPTIEAHAKELAAYSRTKGILSFPSWREVWPNSSAQPATSGMSWPGVVRVAGSVRAVAAGA